jgi:Flp pilus assembly protein protease CpaA
MAAGVLYLSIFLFLYVIGIVLPIQSGIGFGDVKLISVLAFGYLHIGVRSLSIYFLSLCCACSMQIGLQYLQQRRFPNRIAMAPSIFLAVGLYLYAPMGLLLPQ